MMIHVAKTIKLDELIITENKRVIKLYAEIYIWSVMNTLVIEHKLVNRAEIKQIQTIPDGN